MSSKGDWMIERDENGMPIRMRWLPPEAVEAIEKFENERLERNRTLRYVEPSPYQVPSAAQEIEEGKP